MKKEIKTSIENQYEDKEDEAISKIKQNFKWFYTFAQRRSKSKTRIIQLSKTDGNLTKDSQEVANTLNKQYEGKFSKPSEKDQFDNPNEFFAKPCNHSQLFNKEKDNDPSQFKQIA